MRLGHNQERRKRKCIKIDLQMKPYLDGEDLDGKAYPKVVLAIDCQGCDPNVRSWERDNLSDPAISRV